MICVNDVFFIILFYKYNSMCEYRHELSVSVLNPFVHYSIGLSLLVICSLYFSLQVCQTINQLIFSFFKTSVKLYSIFVSLVN